MKPETVQNLQACEKALDVFNLTLVRKQVEVKVEREGKQKAENEKKQQSGGWFGWSTWFGDANSSASAGGSMGDIAQKFEEALTPAEKAKLYAAIDYSENALPLDYPATYQEYQLKFRLHTLMLNIRDALNRDPKSQKIMKLVVDTVETRYVLSEGYVWKSDIKLILYIQGCHKTG
jgi:vacuolar protein sorting-associated protein 13A/C